MIIHNPILTGSFTVNGTDVSSITSSAASLTSLNSYTASQNNRNGTYATTGSNTFTGIQTVNSNLVVTGSITAQTLVVQTVTSSVDFVTGSTRFGSSLSTSTHIFSGSVTMNPGGLFVSGSGNVGIGTTNPASGRKLTVAGGTQFTYTDNGGASFNIVPGTNGQDGADFNLSYYTGTGYGPLTFTLGGSERMRITSGGSVGIGCTPGSITSLDIQNASVTSNNVFLRLQNNAASEDCGLIISGSLGGSPYEYRIGVNTIIASKDLCFQNSSTSGYRWYTDGTNILTLTSAGLKFQNGASSLNYYEEGTWTPAFGGAGSPSYSTQFGRYTRIGNMVYCTIALRATGISGGSTIQITGLPFSAGDASDTGQRATFSPRLGGHINGVTEATARFRVNGNYMDGVKGDLDTTYMTAAQFSSGGSAQITGQFWYYT